MKASRFRYIVQACFLAFLSLVGYRHQILGGGPQGVPPVDALCPFGGMESLHSLLTSGIWLRRVAPSSMILLLTSIVVTLVVGRVFCGWICPLGTLGEWTAALGRKLDIRPRELPEALDRKLRWLKYGVMMAVTGLAWRTGKLAWRDFDPWVAWMHLSAGIEGLMERPWAYMVLLVTVIGASLFIERFWCRYLCPLGAFLALWQKCSIFKVQRNDKTCIGCRQCDKNCPVRLRPMEADRLRSAECLACGRCTDACPIDRTLTFGAGRKRISALTIGLLGLAIFFTGYGVSRATHLWETYAGPPPGLLKTNPADALYGWMSLKQMAETVELPVETVLALCDLPPHTDTDVPVKKLEGIDDEDIREKIRLYLETERQENAPAPTHSSLPPDQIRGSMTLDQVAQSYGIPPDRILEETDWPEETPHDVPLRELKGLYGGEVEKLREAVKKLLEK